MSKQEEPMGGDPDDSSLSDFHENLRTINIDPNHRKRIPVKLLHPDFRCPICMGYMKETSVVMQCLHRFCTECITDSIRLGKNECPTCRVHIPSKRSFRKDERFDLIIQSILGDAQKQDDLELEQIQLMNQGKQRNVKRRAASSRGSSEQKRAREVSLLPTSIPIQTFEPPPLVEFLLVRHADERTLQSLIRYRFRMRGEAPLSVLQCFLSGKLLHQPSTDIQIMIRIANGSCVELNPVLELGQVQRDYFSLEEQTMVLYYRLQV